MNAEQRAKRAREQEDERNRDLLFLTTPLPRLQARQSRSPELIVPPQHLNHAEQVLLAERNRMLNRDQVLRNVVPFVAQQTNRVLGDTNPDQVLQPVVHTHRRSLVDAAQSINRNTADSRISVLLGCVANLGDDPNSNEDFVSWRTARGISSKANMRRVAVRVSEAINPSNGSQLSVEVEVTIFGNAFDAFKRRMLDYSRTKEKVHSPLFKTVLITHLKFAVHNNKIRLSCDPVKSMVWFEPAREQVAIIACAISARHLGAKKLHQEILGNQGAVQEITAEESACGLQLLENATALSQNMAQNK